MFDRKSNLEPLWAWIRPCKSRIGLKR